MIQIPPSSLVSWLRASCQSSSGPWSYKVASFPSFQTHEMEGGSTLGSEYVSDYCERFRRRSSTGPAVRNNVLKHPRLSLSLYVVLKRFGPNCLVFLSHYSFDTSPLRRHTFWTITVGGTFVWISIYGINQAQVQRYVSCKSVTHARL